MSWAWIWIHHLLVWSSGRVILSTRVTKDIPEPGLRRKFLDLGNYEFSRNYRDHAGSESHVRHFCACQSLLRTALRLETAKWMHDYTSKLVLEIRGTKSHKKFTSNYESADCDLKVNQEDLNAWSWIHWVDARYSLVQVHTACLEFLAREYIFSMVWRIGKLSTHLHAPCLVLMHEYTWCKEVIAIYSPICSMFGLHARLYTVRGSDSYLLICMLHVWP